MQTARESLLERAAQREWYHTIELAPGHVTPGLFDHRPYVHHYDLPERMDGMRVLEIGTWDGFWAFEMERRGAQVTALDVEDENDLDQPPRRERPRFPEPHGEGFFIAKEMLDSKVERIVGNVYRALPEDLGQFDVVFAGSILIHLRDQFLALERLANLTKPGGMLITAEEWDPWSQLVPFPVSRYRVDRDQAVVFWQPSLRTWKRMMWSAGFDQIDVKARFRMRSRDRWWVRHAVFHCRKDG
jgi:tRNA (mo5U34)-methyltransferase